MTPFKSVINDMYAKDTSNKVRSTILTKAIAGECIKAFLPYGYKKDQTNKKRDKEIGNITTFQVFFTEKNTDCRNITTFAVSNNFVRTIN